MNHDQLRCMKRAILMATDFHAHEVVTVYREGVFEHFKADRGDSTCAYKGCEGVKCSEGLLHIANPDNRMPEGAQVIVNVCHRHEFTWGALWGTWGCLGAIPTH